MFDKYYIKTSNQFRKDLRKKIVFENLIVAEVLVVQLPSYRVSE